MWHAPGAEVEAAVLDNVPNMFYLVGGENAIDELGVTDHLKDGAAPKLNLVKFLDVSSRCCQSLRH